MTSLRLLCMGDNHGDPSAIEAVLEETEGEEFDFIIHVGDITNACIDGMDPGTQQLAEIQPLFEELATRGELVYVWGNRDFEVCIKGFDGDPVSTYADFDFDVGTHIPTDGVISIAEQRFTQNPDQVDEDTILVTHYYHPELLDHFTGKAYLSGHIHVGRFKNNVLNTGFLYRSDTHGGKPLRGGYFIVEINEDGVFDVTFQSLGGLRKGICPEHNARGVQFVPEHWREDCKFCYDEDDFYEEIIASTRYSLERDGEDVSSASLIERGLKLYENAGVPRDFEAELTDYVEGQP